MMALPAVGIGKRLMSAEYKVAGLSCGPHPEYGTMCCLTLAGSFTDAAAARSSTGNQNKKVARAQRDR